jgi:NAD(P)-dependent dehydrogenase (short-subunit alcohol dehydrogenase family)
MADRVALITGGTRGIGLGIARTLAAEGWSLALNGQRSPEQVSEVAAELEALGVPVLYVPADISIAAERERLIAGVRERFGHLDALVNNAGVGPNVRADILDAGEESFDRLVRINLKGPYFLTQAVARWMLEDGAGDPETRRTIVFVTSISATTASVNRGDYCITKAGLAMASKLWAVRLAEHGINVFEVRPGIVSTDMTAGVRGKYDSLIEDGILLQRRWGQPEDVGRAVASLVRGDFAYSPGNVFMVDGGFSVERL